MPSADADPLHCVKWHPKKPDVLAVGSDSSIYLLNIPEVSNFYGGEVIGQADLQRVGQLFPIPAVSVVHYPEYALLRMLPLVSHCL